MPQKPFVIIVPLLIKSVFFKAKLMLVPTQLCDLFCVFCKYLQFINVLQNKYWPSMVPLWNSLSFHCPIALDAPLSFQCLGGLLAHNLTDLAGGKQPWYFAQSSNPWSRQNLEKNTNANSIKKLHHFVIVPHLILWKSNSTLLKGKLLKNSKFTHNCISPLSGVASQKFCRGQNIWFQSNNTMATLPPWLRLYLHCFQVNRSAQNIPHL